MKIYLAARYSKLPTINQWAEDLEALGHTIVSRWSVKDSHLMPGELSEQAADNERQRFCMEDIEDLQSCDCLISLQEEPRGNGRGGRHVEYGFALALNKRIIIVGPRETVFHHHPNVEHFDSWDEVLVKLTRIKYVSERCACCKICLQRRPCYGSLAAGICDNSCDCGNLD